MTPERMTDSPSTWSTDAMTPADKPEFVKLLTVCYSAAQRPIPAFDVIDLWTRMLEPFPIGQVRAALDTHMRESRQAPVPADVLGRLAPNGDGHLHADEAWALALAARDERESVVWTAEIAQAWQTVCVLAQTDETAARFAFRAAYVRLVGEARAHGTPVRWHISPGHDPQRRVETAEAATRAGRIAIGHARAAVPALPSSAQDDEALSPQALASRERLRELIGTIAATQEQRLARRETQVADDADRTAARKQEIAQQANAYACAHGIRQREPGDDDEQVTA